MMARVTSVVLVLLVSAVPVRADDSSTVPYCPNGQDPSFLFGLAYLKDQVGDPMGDPIECQHEDPATGDLVQLTTTGLATYRLMRNMTEFTNGSEHWALTPDGLAYWTGDSNDPPGYQTPSPTATAVPSTPTLAPAATATPTLLSDADVVTTVEPSVVRIDTGDGCGTGVQVTGGILTAEHVVHGEANIQVTTRSGSTFRSNVLRADTSADLALISGGPPLSPVGFDFVGSMHIGDPVLVLGFAKCTVLQGTPTLTKGLLSAVRTQNNVMYAQTDAAMNPGNSGGPLLDQRGRIVAIADFGINDTQGLGFGIASETINAFLSLPASALPPAPLATPTPRATPTPVPVWAAIATDTKTGSAGWSWNAVSADAAKAGAVNACKTGNCSVVEVTSSGYIALASAGYGGFGWASAETPASAAGQALLHCQQVNLICTTAVVLSPAGPV
jgi:S1-C subfamily serine protease